MKINDFPVIDLFAGPGGLSEGFACAENKQHKHPFRIALSIEKDKYAHQTLLLRAFTREFSQGLPDEYYEYLRGEISNEVLFTKFPREYESASSKAWQAELGSEVFPSSLVDERILKAIGNSRKWVLIGGPPCQAYSVIGRSRMRNSDPVAFAADLRHILYKEYLRILATHLPPIFILENVKGILSSTLDGQNIFSRIISDLTNPIANNTQPVATNNIMYRLYSCSQQEKPDNNPSAFLVRMSRYGIPQDRQRIIVLGIREDISVIPKTLNKAESIVPTSQVISDLPRLRSMLSKEPDSSFLWYQAIRNVATLNWMGNRKIDSLVKKKIQSAIEEINDALPTGSRYMECYNRSIYRSDWFYDEKLHGVCNHMSRSHIKNDIYRYLFATCFTSVHGRSPLLHDFPSDLLPDHHNIPLTLNRRSGLFADRFRVQLPDAPSTTITSHIAKDGHYYIHYDPLQARSLTVREAARLQTFPDNYYFEGPQTSQYQQVGNAVPPLLAKAIAEIVLEILMAY